jgi:hypothetical protein
MNAEPYLLKREDNGLMPGMSQVWNYHRFTMYEESNDTISTAARNLIT